MQNPGAERVKRDIIRLCHAGLDSRALRIEILKRLGAVIPIDLAFVPTADPATLLFTGAVADTILERVTLRFIENEFLHDDVNKFSWLARSPLPVAGLSQVTQQHLEQSPRYRDILAPLALGDELRAALRTDEACWGFMCLHRERTSPPFTSAEADFLSQLTPHIAEGLRKALLLGHATDAPAPDEPGLLLLADDLSVAAVSPAAERWLAELAEADQLRQRGLPYVVAAVAARLQALERGADAQPDLMPKARLRTVSGRWLVLHASRLSGPSAPGQIAVIFEVAQPVEIAPLIVLAYDLSKRESEIMQSVLRGLSTSEISAMAHISSNTVQDHLKAIFEKVGVRSRRELVGQVFAQHYRPHLATGHDPGAYGQFT